MHGGATVFDFFFKCLFKYPASCTQNQGAHSGDSGGVFARSRRAPRRRVRATTRDHREAGQRVSFHSGPFPEGSDRLRRQRPISTGVSSYICR